MSPADLKRMSSRDIGTAYLVAELACDVQDLEREMHRRGEFAPAEWALIQQRWPRDFSYCQRACQIAGQCRSCPAA